MSEIVNIDGSKIVPGKPVKDVVDLLEEMLEQAKAGQINTLACVYGVKEAEHFRVYYDVVGGGMGFDMIGGLEMTKARIIRNME